MFEGLYQVLLAKNAKQANNDLIYIEYML